MTERRLFSIEETATYLGISPRSVRAFITASRLPVVRVGRRVLLDKKQLDRWITSQEGVGTNAEARRHIQQ